MKKTITTLSIEEILCHGLDIMKPNNAKLRNGREIKEIIELLLNNSENVLWNDTIPEDMVRNFYMDYFTNTDYPLSCNKYYGLEICGHGWNRKLIARKPI